MTDIVGSTEHAAELGDAAWRELVRQHHQVVRSALKRHRGREIDTAGDGFFAIFDAPAAAVRCGIEISDLVGKLGIELRAGVHVGEVEQVGGKVAGITVPIASRIMAGAAPGEVLVSSTVRDLTAGSGLSFEDRGVRELKGVPDEWHVYSVKRAVGQAADSGLPAARERRESAVRRAASRPIWQRRPRLVAAATLGLAIVLATGGLLIWKPWQTPALAAVTENSIGIIDPARNELVGETSVGTRPGGIAVGEGYVWVTNTGADSVSQLDIRSHSLIKEINVGRAPKGVAVARGSVWVTNSNERIVSRINAATGRVTQTIEVGNGPTAIAAAGSLLWVANSTDSTVVSIDAQTATVGEPIDVGASPIALAADENGLWVASEDAATVGHHDPVTGLPRSAPIQLDVRPSALALDADSIWVASADSTVTKIDRSTNRVTATIPVGGRLAAIAAANAAIWVGDHEGSVYRLDAANPNSLPAIISTKSAVAALAAVNGEVWLAAHPSAASHRGGTLRIARPPALTGFDVGETDPLGEGTDSVAPFTMDGLVGHRRAGGTTGSALLANLATSVPQPTNGGLTYTFQLRPNLVYSTGSPVLAADFRRGIERSFQVALTPGGGVWGPVLFDSITGAEACINEFHTAVESCDLVDGILTDDDANTVTFQLSAPDPDFLYKLAHLASSPVPDGIPMHELVKGAFPGTGPYMVGAADDHEVRLIRNPYFHVFDADVRPDGYPDEIVFALIDDDASRISMVENGQMDYTAYRGQSRSSHELFARVKTQYAGQWHVGSILTVFALINTSVPPFNNADARRAVNYAIDRAHMAGLVGGAPDAAVTCQLLPPGYPGYKPTCPYTLNPDEGGQWKQPDMQEALRLVEASGTGGAKVVLGPTFPNVAVHLPYLASVLEELGYEVQLIDIPVVEEGDFQRIIDGMERTNITINGWFPDYIGPSSFMGLLTCGGDVVINYCDQDFDAAYEHALSLQTTDPAAAAAAWAALDQRVVDLALMAPLYNAGGDFVSARVGNYQFSPTGVVLLDQMWVQ